MSWRLMEVDHPLLPPGAPALPGLQRIPCWRAAANPGDVGPPGMWDPQGFGIPESLGMSSVGSHHPGVQPSPAGAQFPNFRANPT